MSLAVITDSSVNLPAEIQGHADVYVLDIPVIIEGQPFVEGKNLDVNQFYEQMANSEELGWHRMPCVRLTPSGEATRKTTRQAG